uniref:Uncharacterized protein n=1 Tax=Eutreptiella gymnastica TaxID=73025 RepID=A0A7S1N3R5_9EUGL
MLLQLQFITAPESPLSVYKWGEKTGQGAHSLPKEGRSKVGQGHPRKVNVWRDNCLFWACLICEGARHHPGSSIAFLVAMPHIPCLKQRPHMGYVPAPFAAPLRGVNSATQQRPLPTQR